jgi:hypothetical protein
MFNVSAVSDRLPTAAEIAEINARHLIETPLKPADLLFVFGTRHDEALRAREACRLWREGYFRWSIVSGGVTPGSELSECAVIKQAMVKGGIPPERILEEHCATNTGENVILSLPIIDAALGLKNIRSVICLGNTWTARRYAMTLHRHWPDGRSLRDAACALACGSRIPPPRARRMGQDRALQGQGLYRGMAGVLMPHHQHRAFGVADDMPGIGAEESPHSCIRSFLRLNLSV